MTKRGNGLNFRGRDSRGSNWRTLFTEEQDNDTVNLVVSCGYAFVQMNMPIQETEEQAKVYIKSVIEKHINK